MERRGWKEGRYAGKDGTDDDFEEFEGVPVES